MGKLIKFKTTKTKKTMPETTKRILRNGHTGDYNQTGYQ